MEYFQVEGEYFGARFRNKGHIEVRALQCRQTNPQNELPIQMFGNYQDEK